MLKTVEGVYKEGKVMLSEVPSGIVESPVIVTFLEAKSPEVTPKKMYFGMFADNNQSTEEDLKTVEFHGDIDDCLDWS
ncbi:hypothetical protein G7B40_031595 [Aetokthonos hydrillicola Thurmond2011]|jgi:hypothetical protein|uniref:Uncharacterized protein n=1 Tax=Aetokthonos hydrillicola Thurmond2011 TaxID=2712845 RepID=A0AAP5ICR5_9CYAN|nr:hypothetical protein [Aetokthonos hydrillicola]MBO3461913.1 hypothetical protein [Aetokthonos hydrillicola CCALA 1050]MBW4585422.1 hypothetical protein [Aetokthonos hydrillicola CCALA 1050]MDR9899071.1 hypothetical protein [Aetokthonos hydrillicola Thurmond2011]